MSPFSIQRRVRMLALAPAACAVAFLAIGGLSIANDSRVVGVPSIALGIAAGLAAFLGHKRTAAPIREGIAQTRAVAEAASTGGDVSELTRNVVDELTPIDESLADIAGERRLLTMQAKAISQGDFDAQILDVPAPGPVGRALQESIQSFKRTGHELADSQAVTSSLMNNVSDAVVVINSNGHVVAANDIAKVALDLHANDLEAALPGWREFPSGDHEFSKALPDGSLNITQVSTTRLAISGGSLSMLCWRDISGERAVQAQVAHVARTDIVTGLPNRQGLMAAYDRLSELGRSAGVIHVDLAEFGGINERHGFNEGDHVLQILATRLRKVIRDHDTVARVTGDEFILLLESEPSSIEALAGRILDRIAEPVELTTGQRISIAAHAGWATGTAEPNYELLRQAQYALTAAKEAGEVTHYSEELAARDANRRLWEAEIKRALELSEFELHAQPIVDIFERRVLGVEIFLRWRHPSGRMIMPSEFVALAEESDLITEIDRWVIQRCIREACDSDPSVVFSLNVSSRFMASSEMADYVMTNLSNSGLPAGRIQFDVTETNVAADVAGVIDSIKRLDSMGVKVALDDFGTGYSSLANLLKLAVSTIKIDRRMVSMVHEPEGRGVVAAIMAFARKRRMNVVAEGVETPEEAATLAELDCRYQQGYHYGRPAPLDEVLNSLDSIPFQVIEATATTVNDDDLTGAIADQTAALPEEAATLVGDIAPGDGPSERASA